VKALVDGLAVFEARFSGMPMLDGWLAHATAKQHHLIVDAAGEVQQPFFQILYLDADRVNLADAFADP
jgi:hypothetical protein